MHGRRFTTLLAAGAILGSHAAEAACTVSREGGFAGERVRLARTAGLGEESAFAVYRAPLAVNTDGAPNSYHPDDFLGQRLAINRIDNGIAIRRLDGARLSVDQKRAVFDRWRADGWRVPAGYSIGWTSVIAADASGRPCVFRQGPNAGYFGSLTALKNGLSGAAAGECQSANQLDQRHVPAIVLRGGAANPLSGYGARTGDLVVGRNPATGTTVAAVIGDTGDGNRIGEGSVALNMALTGKPMPTTYTQALGLDTGGQAMVIAVLPGSRNFAPERPFTAENIGARVRRWAGERGYGSIEALAEAATTCSEGL